MRQGDYFQGRQEMISLPNEVTVVLQIGKESTSESICGQTTLKVHDRELAR